MRVSTALLLSGLAAQQVSATWNRGARHFNTPTYNNNECSDKQKEGFNWGDLPEGDFDSYGDFGFKGWKCSNSFGKRDSLTKRTFSSKCIKNKVKKDKPAAFDCNKRKEGFSVKEFQVSVEYDTELEFHYKMPDNSICKQKKSCSKEGTTVENTQCGGARSVEVYLGSHKQKGRDDCEIGFHHIGFDCNPGYTPPNKPSQPPQLPSKPAETPSETPKETPSETPSETPKETPSETPVETPSETPKETPSETPVETPSETPTPSEYPGETPSETPIETPSETPVETPSETPVETPVSTPNETPSETPVETPIVTPPVYGNSSIPVETPISTPPAQESRSALPPPPESSGGYEQPPPQTTSSPEEPTTGPPGVPATPTSGYPESAPAVSTSTPTPENPGYTPPEVLPQCMNTWLEINSECKDNTDADCYCKNPEFTKNVIDCVSAWAGDEETQKALQYLLGICASHVPENPGLITNCPSNIPINPTGPTPSGPAPSGPAAPVPTAPPAGGAPPNVPVTTITYDTTVTDGSTMLTISTTITVPQVVFSTKTPSQPYAPGVTPTEPVELVPGTPAPVPALTTGAPYPIPSGAVPTNFGTVTLPGSNGTATVSQPAQFTGAASSVILSFKSALVGAVLAFLAL